MREAGGRGEVWGKGESGGRGKAERWDSEKGQWVGLGWGKAEGRTSPGEERGRGRRETRKTRTEGGRSRREGKASERGNTKEGASPGMGWMGEGRGRSEGRGFERRDAY